MVLPTLEDATQARIDDGIALIKHWLANGYSLKFAISQFNSCTTLGLKSREKVYNAFK